MHVIDAMVLHKGTVWDPKIKCYVGTVDYGTASPEATDKPATDALIFMVVGITGHWKHPIAYALLDKCSAYAQAKLIKDCIGLLQTQDINVLALDCHGTFMNQHTDMILGAMKVFEIRPWFTHPEKSNCYVMQAMFMCQLSMG